MICKHCGKEIADQSVFCPACGGKVERIRNDAAMQPSAVSGAGTVSGRVQGGLAVNNLFARFLRDRHQKGIMCEFILWISICLSCLLSLINVFMLISKISYGDGYVQSILLWGFLFLLEIGFGVFVAFRWQGISILYGITIFLLVMLIPFYIVDRGLMGWYIGYDGTNFMTVCFALALMTAMGLVVCGAFEFFTKIKIKLAVFICSIVEMSLIACMVVLPYLILIVESNKWGISSCCYCLLLGSMSYFVVCCTVTLYTVFYCKEIIDSDKGNLFHLNGLEGGKPESVKGEQVKTEEKQALVGIQCLHGNYQGQVFPVQGEIIIGSQPGSAHIVLQDAYVSKQHCRIRFNAASGNYELIDLSTNGVFLENGVRLQSNMYHSCPRGTVLYLGSQNQKYRLM